jgi:hypothetical protein
MKTDRSARRRLAISIIMDSIALAAVVGSELWLGASWATRVGHTNAYQTQEQPVPNVGIYYLITEVR